MQSLGDRRSVYSLSQLKNNRTEQWRDTKKIKQSTKCRYPFRFSVDAENYVARVKRIINISASIKYPIFIRSAFKSSVC